MGNSSSTHFWKHHTKNTKINPIHISVSMTSMAITHNNIKQVATPPITPPNMIAIDNIETYVEPCFENRLMISDNNCVENELTMRIKRHSDHTDDHENKLSIINKTLRDFKQLNEDDVRFIETQTTVSEKVKLIKLYNIITNSLLEYVQQ